MFMLMPETFTDRCKTKLSAAGVHGHSTDTLPTYRVSPTFGLSDGVNIIYFL